MKSQVIDLVKLAETILYGISAKCSTTQIDLRDLKTIRSRVKHEGLSFLTMTLPEFGKDFDRSLEDGKIETSLFRNFRKNGRIPAFLQGIVSRVFDINTGGILNEPDKFSIEGVRQLSYAFKKLKSPCTPERVQAAYDGFVECEAELSVSLSQNRYDDFHHLCDLLWGRVLGHRYIDVHDFVPKHGPGAVAEGITGNSKYHIRRWHKRLEPYFPLDAFAICSYDSMALKELEGVSLVAEDDEQPVKVIAVPKTLKTPRLIAVEPLCMQYTQQSISRFLVGKLERHWLTSGHVNFTDQSINQSLAVSSSCDRSFATLDLSSASDRVPLSLASCMFDSHPDLRDAILACRSTRAQIGSEVISLRKFASMGSALCFPVESMYFYTLCIEALLDARDLPVTIGNIYKVSRSVFVYGDDIVVPTDAVGSVIVTLQEHYCKVNVAKSFFKGNFRESCGTDAYSGHIVTPTYVRNFVPSHRRQASEIISAVATMNHFRKKGFHRTAAFLQDSVEKLVGKLPAVRENSPVLGVVSERGFIVKYDKSCQSFKVRGLVPVPVYRTDILDGYSALMKCFLTASHMREGDKKHLMRSTRPYDVALKRRWVLL